MSRDVQAEIRDTVESNRVVLFMKGTPSFPQCGFSAAVVQILSELGVSFVGVNVLADGEVREGIKRYSSWPTLPQLFVDGKLIGGCDITRELHERGELAKLLEVAPAA